MCLPGQADGHDEQRQDMLAAGERCALPGRQSLIWVRNCRACRHERHGKEARCIHLCSTASQHLFSILSATLQLKSTVNTGEMAITKGKSDLCEEQ